MSSNESEEKKEINYRVKVYNLEDNENWKDKGTGHVQMEDLKEEKYMRVDSETDQEIILRTKIHFGVHYAIQNESLIVWTEENGDDLALSFQEAEACNEFWKQLKEEIDRQRKCSQRYNIFGGEDIEEPINVQKMNLLVNRVLRIPGERERLAEYLIQHNYIDQLIEIFKKADDKEVLVELFGIMKGMVLLGDHSLYLELVRDENISFVLGMLEFEVKKNVFRDFMASAKYIEVFENENFEEKAKQVFRLQYLRDVVVARYLDDPFFNNLTDSIRQIYTQIINFVLEPNFVEEILNQFETKKQKVALFLQQVSHVAKQSCVPQNEVYQTLFNLKINSLFQIMDEDVLIRQCFAEFIGAAVEADRLLVQVCCLETKLHIEIIDQILKETDDGLLCQFTEIIKMLLEETEQPFIRCFFEVSTKLISYLSLKTESLLKSEQMYIITSDEAKIYFVWEIILSLSKSDANLFKKWFLKQEFIDLMYIYIMSSKHICLLCIRIIKILVQRGEDMFIMQHNLINLVLRVLKIYDKSNNLVNSCCLDFVDEVKKSSKHLKHHFYRQRHEWYQMKSLKESLESEDEDWPKLSLAKRIKIDN